MTYTLNKLGEGEHMGQIQGVFKGVGVKKMSKKIH